MAYVGITVKPGTDVDSIVERIAAIPEITECHIVTGRYDLVVKLQARDNNDMLKIIRDGLRSLDIASTETMLSFRQVFSREVPITND